MIKAFAQVQGVRFTNGSIDVDVTITPKDLTLKPLTATMTFANGAGALSSQAIGAIKTRVIAFAAAPPYNATVIAEEIVVIGVG